MVTLELKSCKEMVVFRALTENERFLDACKTIMKFDQNHPEQKILSGGVDKEVLRMCFEECRKTLVVAFPKGEKPDFGNVSHLNRLGNVFNQQLPRGCQKTRDNFTSALSGKIRMGQVFLDHMDYIGNASLKYYKSLISEEKRESEKRTHEQVTVDSYRRLGQGYGSGKVFSPQNTYKTSKEVLVARICAERRQKGSAS